MNEMLTPVMQPLGDAGLLVSWGNYISRDVNDKVIALSKALLDKPFEGMIDCVQAYSSLAILYDLTLVNKFKGKYAGPFEYVKQQVALKLRTLKKIPAVSPTVIEIPVCYDETLGNDLTIISRQMNVSIKEIIKWHTGKTYHVYMPGFMPGFVYMGEVDKRIAIPRKEKPVTVQPGAVGIAGIQTGIYPAASPGGWHIVGYTSYQMFDAAVDDPCLLHAGDEVQFIAVSLEEFKKIKQQQHEHQHS